MASTSSSAELQDLEDARALARLEHKRARGLAERPIPNDEAIARLTEAAGRDGERFASAAEELRRFGGLPQPAAAKQIWDDIWHLEAHHSTAIEGNTLVLREVEALLDERRAVGAKDLKDYLEVLGYGEAARWVYGQTLDPGEWRPDGLIAITEVRQLHYETMRLVWEVAPHPEATAGESPGRFRRHEIRPFGEGMLPPSWTDVEPQLSGWVREVDDFGAAVRTGACSPAELPVWLAALHCGFERIHPFIDGNGRVGRLVLNLILVRLGYPPTIIFKRDRDRYLDALARADDGDPGALGELIARSVIDNLHRFVVPDLAGPERLVPLRSLATKALSYQALRQAARRGRLEAELASDGTWRSSRAAVETYRKNRFKRSKTQGGVLGP